MHYNCDPPLYQYHKRDDHCVASCQLPGGVISREPRDCYIRNKKILLAAAFSRHDLQLLSNMLHGYL